MQTGNVIPQFHFLFDPGFNNCKRDVKFQSIWQHKARLHTDRKMTPSAPSPEQPHMDIINFFELALDIKAHLYQPWDTTAPTPETSVNSLPLQQTLTKRLESLYPTNDSAHPTKNAPVQSTQDVTIPLLALTPAVIMRCGSQSKPPSKFSDSAHSSFLASISTFLPQQYQPFQHLLHPDVESQSTPHPFALASNHIYGIIGSDPYTMRFNEAMKQHDQLKLLVDMQKELEDQVLCKYWKVITLR